MKFDCSITAFVCTVPFCASFKSSKQFKDYQILVCFNITLFWGFLVYVSSENYSDYVGEHPDTHPYNVQCHATERTNLQPLEPLTAQNEDYYLTKAEDPSRNPSTAAVLQETGGDGGEDL